MPRRALLLIGAVALFHATLFIVYQQPDWDVAWSDQGGYKQLGAAMARSGGEFTRFPDSPVFIPEVIRTPGYPAFVAVIYRLFGVNTLPVAIAQAFVFVGICLIVYALTRRLAGERAATLAAFMTALFPPLPYYGALVLTEVWTTLVLMAAMLACLRAVQQGRRRDFMLAGLLFSAATIVRPAFVLLPFGLAIAMPLFVPAERSRRRIGNWAALALVAAIRDQLPYGRNLPVILLSGLSPDEIQQKMGSLRQPVLPPLFIKPVDPTQLIEVVEMQLAGAIPDAG